MRLTEEHRIQLADSGCKVGQIRAYWQSIRRLFTPADGCSSQIGTRPGVVPPGAGQLEGQQRPCGPLRACAAMGMKANLSRMHARSVVAVHQRWKPYVPG